MLEAPIYSNRCIEDAWTFLLEIARRHPNRQKHIQECARQLGQSYNWCLVLRGSKQARAVLQELPKPLQCAILECTDCLDLLDCSWSSPPPAEASAQNLAMVAPSWHSEEATERAALAQRRASTPPPGVPGQNSRGFGASPPDSWAQWEAKVARPPPQAVLISGPSAGRNPFRPASEPAVGMTALNGRPARPSTPTASGGPQSNPFAAAVPQVNSPQATSFPTPHDTTNPFKARLPDSKGKVRQRTHSVGAATSRTVGGRSVPANDRNWTSEGTWSRPALVSAF